MIARLLLLALIVVVGLGYLTGDVLGWSIAAGGVLIICAALSAETWRRVRR